MQCNPEAIEEFKKAFGTRNTEMGAKMMTNMFSPTPE